MDLDEIIVGMHAMMEDMTGDPCQCRVCQDFDRRIRLEQELERRKSKEED